MARYYAIEIRIDGRRYTGDWTLLLGGRLCVRSRAWGSLTVEIGEDEPISAAQLALSRIVEDHAKARAEELKRQEREAAKLRKPRRRKPPPDDGPAPP